ncbi:MAG TPA: phosphoglycerate dehydrogenase, partial [Herpetosiphonaceae bacterium]|nr:phosphoglycerate dehydrogenase [Herpetosiphonaceae bacterium]
MDRILITEKIGDEGLATLKGIADVDLRLNLAPDALKEILPEYDALVVRSQTKVIDDVLEAGTRLRVVGRAGTGVDNIDLAAATRRGILVVNAPASNSIAVAELTIGLLICLARQIPQAHASLEAGRWDRGKYMGSEVRGKTLGLLGLGRIGAEVARRARALEMRILAYDPFISMERAEQLGVHPVTLDELLRDSDAISLHVPLLDSTRNLLNAERLAQMKRGAWIVNCARGGIIDEPALLEALESGHIGGAAIDVWAKEPPAATGLVGHPRVIGLPHLGASTEEAQALTAADVAEGVVDALAGRTPRYAVNAPFVAPEEWKVVAPYVQLGTILAKLSRQLLDEPARSYEIIYGGELAGRTTEPIRLAILAGLLEGTSEARITPVNAALLARERGITVRERHQPEADQYAAVLELCVTSADGTEHTFGGTTVQDEPHIVQVDSYRLDVVPSQAMLITFHRDRPGLIGLVG